MNFCLSDLVPPLRWSDAARIRTLTEPVERDGLPDAWWRSLPMARVLAVLSADRLAELLTELALEHWPAAAIGDILPALYVAGPDDADDPQVEIALDRAGSWAGLLALTGRELLDQPFIKARPMLTALFGAVFARLAEGPGTAGERAEPAGRAERQGQAEPLPPAMFPPAGPAAFPPASSSLPASAVESAPAAELPGQESPTPAPGTRRRDPSDLFTLVDVAFADLDDQAWAVAQNRIFTDQPSEADQLAKLFAVPTERIVELEERLRQRLADWLAGPEAEPYRRHLETVAESLGAAAPKSRLIAAADWHSRELRSLDVPAWQFVLATLPEHRLTGDWLVTGDLAELQEKTRRLVLDAERPPTVAQATRLVASLGIHAEVAKEWLESVPGLRIEGPGGKPAEAAGPDAEVRPEPERPEPESAGQDAADRPEATGPDAAERPEAAEPLPEAAEAAPAVPAEPEAPPAEPERRGELPADALEPAFPPAAVAVPDRGPEPEPVPGTEPPLGDPLGDRPAKPLRPPYGAGPEPMPWAARPPVPDAPAPEPAPAPAGADPLPKRVPGASVSGEPRLDLVSSPSRPVVRDGGDGGAGLKDVALTRRCFRQPDGRWWFRIDVSEDHLAGGPCAIPSGFAAYLGMQPGESRTVRCATGELTLSWQARPALETIRPLLIEAGAQVGGHLFVTVTEDGMLRARHLPAVAGADKAAQALRLVGYTAPGGTMDQALRVIATRVGMDGATPRADLLGRLRERGDRDLLSLLATPVTP